jgi:hypothetical protein
MTRSIRQVPAPEAAGRRLEAEGLPITLAEALQALARELPALRAVIERQADPRPAPLVYRKADAARMCGMAVRTLEYLASAGKFPRPDAFAGRINLWTRATLERWVREGGGRL